RPRPVRGGDVPAEPDRSIAQGPGSVALAPLALEAAPRAPGPAGRLAAGRARIRRRQGLAAAPRPAAARRGIRRAARGSEPPRRELADAARFRRLGPERRQGPVPRARRPGPGEGVRLKLVPLGTSAGRPTLLRGASAFAAATEGSWVLCDCGEGAQLSALRAGLSLSRLDAVLITHLHGDHFNGLPGLLGTLGLEGRQRTLVVAGPPGITSLLQHLASAGSLGTGDMEVRVFEQQGNGGELRLEGSPFLV